MGEFFQRVFCIYWDDHMVFIFQFVNIVYIDWFASAVEFLHSWNKLNLITTYEFFDVLLILFPKFCWGFLHLRSSVIFNSSFHFLCCFCMVLVWRWWWHHKMNLEMFLPLQFLESFRRTGISSSLNVWQFSCEATESWAFGFGGIFDHSFKFSACNWVVLNFYFFLIQT